MSPPPSLSDDDARDLRLIARLMVPPDGRSGLPGADDDVIFADIMASLGLDQDAVRVTLADIRRHGMSAPLADLDTPEAGALVDAWRKENHAAAMLLTRAIVQCYYRDDRVLRSLGVEPRPPFPLGHTLEEIDTWTLLDDVRARGRIWRDASS